MRVTVRKYYSQGSRSEPVAAQKLLDSLQEKHPERDYCILTNVRGNYTKFSVVQYADVTVDVPSKEEMLGPEPERPPYLYSTNRYSPGQPDPAWTDYENLMRKRSQDWSAIITPIMQKLRGSLNK